MQLLQAVPCPLPGLETVTVQYNMMATGEQVETMHRRMGGDGSHAGVIAAVEGWPEKEFGADPWDIKRAPLVWFAWASRKGWALAMKEYLNDPNS